MYCTNCGKKIHDNAAFCPYCGRSTLSGTEVPEGPSDSGKKHKRNKPRKRHGRILAVLLAAMAVFAFFILALRLRGDGPQSRAPDESEDAGGLSVLEQGFTQDPILNADDAMNAAQKAAGALGRSNALEELSPIIENTSDGNRYYRMQQCYQGIPVYGRYVIVVASESGEALGLSTDAEDIPEDLPLEAEITDEQALEAVRSYAMYNWDLVHDDISMDPLDDSRLVIYDLDETEPACLAYCVNVNNGGEHYEVVLDAKTGAVLDAVSTLHGISAVGRNEDGSLEFPVSFDEANNTYTMVDEGRNIHVYYFNGVNSGDRNFAINQIMKVQSTGDTVFGNTEEERQYHYERGALFFHTIERIADYYEVLGQGIPFGEMHIGYDDAFRAGRNACGGSMSENGSSLGVIFLGTVISADKYDVLTHEYTHAVSAEHNAARRGDPIQEGLADTFAIFASAYFNQSEPVWEISDASINLHRSAIIPEQYNRASTIDNFDPDRDDHDYATVISRAAYLMYESQRFTIDQLQTMWFRAMLRLPYYCTFAQFRTCMIQEVLLEYGKDSRQMEAVKDALDQVGIVDHIAVAQKTKADMCLSNNFTITVYNKTGQEYENYSLQITGRTKGGWMGIGSKEYSLSFDRSTRSTGSLNLEDGTYTITLTDYADHEKTKLIKITVDGEQPDDNKKDSLEVFTNFGTEYIASPGAGLVIYDKNGHEITDFTVTAESETEPGEWRNGKKTVLDRGTLDLPEGHRYRIVLSVRDEPKHITYYEITTVLIKADTNDKLELFWDIELTTAEEEPTSEPEWLDPVEIPQAVTFIGQPLGSVFSSIGTDYHVYEQNGGILFYYDELGIGLGVPADGGAVEQAIVTSVESLAGDYSLYHRLNHSMTFPQIRQEMLETDGITITDPVYEDNEDGGKHYVTEFHDLDKRYHFLVTWQESPEDHAPDSIFVRQYEIPEDNPVNSSSAVAAGTYHLDVDCTNRHNTDSVRTYFGSSIQYGNEMVLKEDGSASWYIGAGYGGEGHYQFNGDSGTLLYVDYEDNSNQEVTLQVVQESENKWIAMDLDGYKLYWTQSAGPADDDQDQESESDGDDTIPSDCLRYNGHSYYVYPGETASTWEEAIQFCQSVGGHLATICDSDENQAIYDYMRDKGYSSAYFGYSDVSNEGTWSWVTSESISYTNWYPGEPNAESSREDYAMFYWKFSNGQWNDGSFATSSTVSDTNAFICEWDYQNVNPETPTETSGHS